MRIDDIDALLATVQFSSLNQAAEYLGITQSAITRRLQRLEQTLNVTLLERQTRPLTLTAAGHRVYEQCLSIKRETKKLYGLLDPEAEPHGILRLGVPQSVAEIALQPALTALRQQFPALRPQVTCGWSGLLQKRLESVELDGVLAMGPEQQRFAEGYGGRLLCPLDIVVIAAKSWRLHAGALRDYAERGWVLNPDGCGLRAGLIRELQSQGLRLALNVETAGAQLQISLVAQGLGLGLVPRAALAASPWRDEVTVLTLADFQPEVHLWLVHAQNLANLSQPLTFFAGKVVQQLNVSG
ncbi:LysR family transcriptional regulator [Klebsiella michiganensis]|uniref:LysR family transcriptional regulator n=2 Tax=Klebsiella michiganensis TaxID=1134687 RepID=A0AB35WBQ3_9ENTR|nr:LysR family transcriptional regulator [Klebsiella michiganensis]MBZ7244088.1 LysR family transcriptional regulator [Klebsiella michiganensis]MBZ7301534.1 LysR family transcriptional regulator [Klebsiella michiganensis]MBZ7355942.1 LysR family transcriptional regulator [Klebsiella michiganensis]MBZ7499879.1 LysR family transcriptional regulator [Klebsiella michiganensis]MDU1150838.1 LysR family transcriptional regulator [Klebsiella michiganensis]